MLAAITEEKVSAAGRAQLARNDVRRFHTCVKQLPAVGCAQVEPDARRRGVVTRRGHREPLERVWFLAGGQLIERPVKPFAGLRKLPRIGLRHLRAHFITRSEEHTSELQSRLHRVCRLLLEKKKK